MRQQVPNAMYEPEYEGALMAPMYNGDRYVLTAV
jgi:hypothetical protein